MIVWGIKARLLRSIRLMVECLVCHTNSHQLQIYQRYFHLFWIPTIPLNKVAILECDSCKKATAEKEMAGPQKDVVNREKSGLNPPAWSFVGLVLLVGLIGYGVWDDRQEDEQTRSFVLAPEIGDILVLPIGLLKSETFAEGDLRPDDKFAVGRLIEVQKDSVRFHVANYVFVSGRDAKRGIKKKAHEITFFSADEGQVRRSDLEAAEIPFVMRQPRTQP